MGFTAAWLSLREPADRAARDQGLMMRAAGAAGPDPVILDLGCGTGSTLRALAPHLPPHAQWRLVDNDPVLLDAAGAEAPGRTCRHLMDLRDLDALPLQEVTLVTASALLDLMPACWVEALALRLAQAGLPFHATLSYDGIMKWDPPLPGDPDITRAFNRHQRGDKGLGPALGPDAADRAAAIFRRLGFHVSLADSPWHIRGEGGGLQPVLLQGIAAAALEAGMPMALDWLQDRVRMVADSHCRIGHVDLLALPRQSPAP